MIPIHQMKIIQIDVTNACMNRCSNCTRFSGHHQKPFYMDLETYKKAVDSMQGFDGIVGMIGGEPLLHPNFEEMARYIQSRIKDPKKRGLWSTMPAAKAKKYGSLIKEVFGSLFLNDHSVQTIRHQPIMVSPSTLIKDEKMMWEYIDNCWVQTMWSATITPKGAFFCEVAASFDMLFNGPGGWPIEPGWWKREPDEFTEQKERWCTRCSCSIPLEKRRSTDEIDDVDEYNLEELKKIDSPKVRAGKVRIYDQGLAEGGTPDNPNWYMQEVENEKEYRQNIAARLDEGCSRTANNNESPTR